MSGDTPTPLRMPWLLLVGIVFGLGASGVSVLAYVVTRSTTTPVSFPIDLKIGSTQSSAFRIDRAGHYDVGLHVEEPRAVTDLACVLDTPAAAGTCRDIPAPVDLSWVLSRAGTEIARGTSTDQRANVMFRGGALGRRIGSFDTASASDFVLVVSSNRDATVLSPAKTRIQVTRALTSTESFLTSMGIFASLPTLGLMLTLGVVVGRRMYRQRPQ